MVSGEGSRSAERGVRRSPCQPGSLLWRSSLGEARQVPAAPMGAPLWFQVLRGGVPAAENPCKLNPRNTSS